MRTTMRMWRIRTRWTLYELSGSEIYARADIKGIIFKSEIYADMHIYLCNKFDYFVFVDGFSFDLPLLFTSHAITACLE